MLNLKLLVTTLLLLLVIVQISSAFDTYNSCGTNSIEESKRYKLFMGLAQCNQSKFNWQDHIVTVQQPWVEHTIIWRSGKMYSDPNWVLLCFKILIDGKQEYNPTRRIIIMPVNFPLHDYTTVIIPSMLQSAKLYVLGRNGLYPGYVRRTIVFPANSLPSEVRVRMVTSEETYQDKNGYVGKTYIYNANALSPEIKQNEISSLKLNHETKDIIITFKLLH